jgi:hypothetical protein
MLIISKHDPRATVHIVHTASNHILDDDDRIKGGSLGGDGIANGGGTNSHTFVKDGETSYLAQHLTYVFASSARVARQFQPPTEDMSMALVLPETFQAPHLRHLLLLGFTLPIGSRSLTTAVGLVTLDIVVGHPSTYFQPNTLL